MNNPIRIVAFALFAPMIFAQDSNNQLLPSSKAKEFLLHALSVISVPNSDAQLYSTNKNHFISMLGDDPDTLSKLEIASANFRAVHETYRKAAESSTSLSREDKDNLRIQLTNDINTVALKFFAALGPEARSRLENLANITRRTQQQEKQ